MRKFLQKSVALLIMLGFILPAFAAVVPTADDGKWYNVKSQRGNDGLFWTKTGNKIIPNQLTNSDAQKFTLVTSSAGKVTIKAFDGTKFNGTDFDATGTTDGWTITQQNVQGVSGVSFPGQNQGLHQGTNWWNWEVRHGYYDLGDNCTFFFYEAGTYIEPPTFNTNEDGYVLVGDDRFTITSPVGTVIKYTTDNTDPITSPTAITSPSDLVNLTITSEMKGIKAVTIAGGNNASDVATFDKIVKEAEVGKEYHIVFQRNGAVSALTAGNPLTLEAYNIGQENQVFVFGKAATDGLYTLTTRGGEEVQYLDPDGNGSEPYRFRTSPTTTATELRIVQFGDNPNYEIERKGTTANGMNPAGGFANGKEIAEYGNGDLSNELNFVEAPAADASDAPTLSVPNNTVVVNNDMIEISAPNAEQIIYTLDGTDPETSGTATTVSGTSVDITITAKTFVKVFAKETGKTNSPVIEATYYNIDLDYSKEYQLVLRREGNNSAPVDNLAITAGDNDGDALTAEVYATGQSTQIFTISKSTTTKGLYTLTTKSGKKVYADGTDNAVRFRTGTTAGELRIIKFEGSSDAYKEFEPGYSIQRIENTARGMNPFQGSVAGHEIAEWNNGDGGNSLNFEEVPELTWIGESLMAIGGNTGTWYKGRANSQHPAFHQTNIGDFATEIVLGGEIQAYAPVNAGITMWYKIDNGDEQHFTLPRTGTQGNNSKHYAETTIDISTLSAGNHTLSVWFKGDVNGNVEWDSNDNSTNYVANFTKTSTGVEKVTLAQGISVNNGIITVKGVKDFEVYSLAGQQVNAKQALQAGVYIVKVKDTAVKVVVK